MKSFIFSTVSGLQMSSLSKNRSIGINLGWIIILATIWTGYLERYKKFDIYFCVFFNCNCQSLDFERETGQ